MIDRAPRSWPLMTLVAGVGVATLGLLVASSLGAVQGFTTWIVATQRELHAGLAAALNAVRDGGLAAAWPLIGLSFGYGVFHAAGPGHGKVVVSTYLASHESRLGNALMLTTLAALAQAVTAIVAVHVAVTLLDLGLRQARTSVAQLDALSFGLIAALGLALVVRAALALLRRSRGAPAAACEACGHHHHADHAHGDTERSRIWAALGVILSVGIRPCAGGVVVLLLAYAGDLRLVGILAVLAMAIGTALTTGALAGLAVLARRQAVRLAAWLPGGDGRLALYLDVFALGGGLVLFALGIVLLQASLVPAPPHPFR